MRTPLGIWLCLVVALGAAGPLPGAEVTGLYEAEVVAAGREPAAQDDAVVRALREVLVKVSGRRAPQANPVIAEALGAAGRFVAQFRYRSVASPQAEPGSPPELRLWARFDARVVDALVRDSGLPLWGRVRPSLLAWLAVERDGRRELVAADDPAGLAATALATATRRGVPLTLPLLDLEDRAAIGVMDVWGGFTDKVAAASARYQPDALLLGRIYAQPPALWEGRWTLSAEGVTQEWTDRGELPEVLVEGGLEEAADRLAARYAGLASPAGPQSVAVIVEGVESLASYARVVGYLEGLDGVERVDVDGASGERLDLRVLAEGGREALAQVIGLGQVLGPEPGRVAGLHLRVRR